MFQICVAGQWGMLFIEPTFCCSYIKQTATIVLSSRAWRLRFGAAQNSKTWKNAAFVVPMMLFWEGGQFDMASVCSGVVCGNTLTGKRRCWKSCVLAKQEDTLSVLQKSEGQFDVAIPFLPEFRTVFRCGIQDRFPMCECGLMLQMLGAKRYNRCPF